MTEKVQDNTGFKEGVALDGQIQPKAVYDSSPEPVDFGAAIAEIENSHPELLNKISRPDDPRIDEILTAFDDTCVTADPRIRAEAWPVAGFDLVKPKDEAIEH